MCEQCDKVREDSFAEIRDLLNFNRALKGPASEELAARIEEARTMGMELPEEGTLEFSRFMDSVRAEMIAVRCAIIAKSAPDTFSHEAPCSMILGSWAGKIFQIESAAMLAESGLGSILGMLLGNNDEGEDD